MSTQRYIDVSFYDDSWVQELDPSEKFMYMYLLTNPLTNIAGVYKITSKRMSFDTGFNIETVNHILDKFMKSEKVFRKDDYLILKNWCKHQKVESSQSKQSNVKIGIDRILNELPDEVLLLLKDIGYTYKYLDDIIENKGLQGALSTSNYLNLNLDLNLDLNSSTQTHDEEIVKNNKIYHDKEKEELQIRVKELETTLQEKEEELKKQLANASSSKDSEKKTTEKKKYPKADYDEVYALHNKICKWLCDNNRLSSMPTYSYKVCNSVIKKAFDSFGKDKVLEGIKNAVKDRWCVEKSGFCITAILSEKVLFREINKQFYDPYQSNGRIEIKKGQSAFVDKERDFSNITNTEDIK